MIKDLFIKEYELYKILFHLVYIKISKKVVIKIGTDRIEDFTCFINKNTRYNKTTSTLLN